MLQVYNYDPNEPYIQNDSFFERNTYDVIVDEKKGARLRNVISKIEQVEFVDNAHIRSKFNDEIISIGKISTGCKTIINIMVFPDRVFDVEECGDNVLSEIYKLTEGKIYNPYPLVLSDIKYNKDDYNTIKYNCRSKNGNKIIVGLWELREWYNEQ